MGHDQKMVRLFLLSREAWSGYVSPIKPEKGKGMRWLERWEAWEELIWWDAVEPIAWAVLLVLLWCAAYLLLNHLLPLQPEKVIRPVTRMSLTILLPHTSVPKMTYLTGSGPLGRQSF